VPNAQPVEQVALRIAEILFAADGHRLFDLEVDGQGIEVAVMPDSVGWPLVAS
jgi:hypothetical protein